MKKRIVFCVCGALLVLSGCAATGEKEVGLNKEPVPVIETVQNAAETTIEKTRKDGERFEDVIILEGMEEPVNYEHAINDAIGIEISEINADDYLDNVRLSFG